MTARGVYTSARFFHKIFPFHQIVDCQNSFSDIRAGTKRMPQDVEEHVVRQFLEAFNPLYCLQFADARHTSPHFADSIEHVAIPAHPPRGAQHRRSCTNSEGLFLEAVPCPV
jgi:hypothetical protein